MSKTGQEIYSHYASKSKLPSKEIVVDIKECVPAVAGWDNTEESFGKEKQLVMNEVGDGGGRI